MDAVLKNFKAIPCPSGDRCTAPNCPWQHSWERSPDVPGPGSGTGTTSSEDHDGPRKRRKTSPEPQSDFSDSVSRSVTSKSSTSTTIISPPPLKRKVPSSTYHFPDPRAFTPPNPTTVSRPVVPAKTPAPIARSKATPRKPETLNPRHLKTSAPAAHDFRFKALKMLHDQLQRLNNELKKSAIDPDKKLLLSPQELVWMALDEEEKMATDKPSIYNNVIKNRIMNLKRMNAAKWREERTTELKRKEDREAVASGKTPATKPILGTPREIVTGMTPEEEVAFLTFLLTPVSKLSQYGYVTTVPTDQEIAKAREGEEASMGWEVCDRCDTRFQVFPGRREGDGALTSGGHCVYHYGRPYFPPRSAGEIGQPAKQYRCCQSVLGESPGCVKCDTHVFKANAPSRLAALNPFVETPPNSLAPKDRAVCFDCEMGYTVRGMELIRLTATSWPDGKELLDVLVQPIGEILDLNSRYSGVWPQDIVNAEPWSALKSAQYANASPVAENGEPKKKKKMLIVSSPVVARDLLFSLISPDTPLIGHGLENDLNTVRIVHPTIIDTVLLYPHKRGLPIRHGLKMLMETQLNKAIQMETGDTVVGHDSAEDARAAGELVRLKVEEKWKIMKGQGWRLKDGVFLPPFATGKKAPISGSLSEKFLEDGEN
ncbi:hypothetical protein B0H67DRAFT_486849 [Lasiosphaeris hirsuta]|uniref:Exonuclease domain-containing protein n=1 Tax=Lasiosphaeris hirsuta TaxID=260670 RepID=A0AA40ARW4_9PEZI|nr:hypothetical protein B0H67DRAFT_486849 [Lasiosphaeris hirsuta]